MKLKLIIVVFVSYLILLFSGCTKPEVKHTVKPFEDIPIESTKRIEFSDFTVTSSQKELGRSKMVTNAQDIQEVLKYLKTIDCIESNRKPKDSDFSIAFIDNTENAKSYIYSIGISKNQIFIYKHKEKEPNEFVYKYSDIEVIEEISKLYNSLNYEEELLMKK